MEIVIIAGEIIIGILAFCIYRSGKRNKWVKRDNNPYNNCKRNEEYRIKLVSKDGENDVL
jgi:hypothetical protein